MGLSSLILRDCVYKQNTENAYQFDHNNNFFDEDIDSTMDAVQSCLVDAYTVGANKLNALTKCSAMHIDFIALQQALFRYSRDVYGQQRFKGHIDNVFSQKEKMGVIESNMKSYGFKVSSFDPYLHRRIATLFYWFSVLKPFHMEVVSGALPEEKTRDTFFGLFNELSTTMIVQAILRGCEVSECKIKDCKNKNGCKVGLKIIDHKDIFNNFLHDLHFRRLSRSSLELFLGHFCVFTPSSGDNCPLNELSYFQQCEMITLSECK